MISLYVPPKKMISDFTQKLSEEQGTAEQIKSSINKKSVITALGSVRERLKLYSKVPPNGLVIFCGTICASNGKSDKILIDFEPFKPITRSLYHCDSIFHVEPLQELLTCDETYGFIVVDGNGALFGKLSGNYKEVVSRYNVNLPKKHGRGGQSQKRFERIADEKRHHHLREVSEHATQIFITNDRPNVAGLIVAGAASFKTKLVQSDMFDQRLKPKVMKVVDVSYGGENGFNQAIEMCQDLFKSVKYVEEKRILAKFFKEVSTDSKLYCASINTTMTALIELGAVEHLIIYEDLDAYRVVLRSKETGKEKVVYLQSEEIKDDVLVDKEMGYEMEIMEKTYLAEWLAENYTNYGVKLSLLSNESPEGFMFVKGFQGIGAFLRYEVNLDSGKLDEVYGMDDEDDDGFM